MPRAEGARPRRVTIKDVAARAGVSWKTVSNVVNDRPVVSPATRERVQQAIDELGYVPNVLGRDLRGGPTRRVALVVPELSNPYFALLAEKLQVAAARRGYDVQIQVSLGRAEVEQQYLTGVPGRPVDAVIMSPQKLTDRDIYARTTDVPLVLLGERVRAGHGVSHVAIDNVASAVDVTRHLLERGCTRLLFLGVEGRHLSTGAERLLGVRAALRASGGAASLVGEIPLPEWGRERGQEATRRALAEGAEADGIIAANDLVALGALTALREAGRAVPADVAVVGWDDLPESAYAVPALTTVAPGLEALVAATLDAALDPASGGQEVVVGHRLVVRESSGGPAVAPGAATA